MITIATVWLIKIGVDKTDCEVPVGLFWTLAVLADCFIASVIGFNL